jgi:hypothetical protein
MQFMSAPLNPCRWFCGQVVIRRHQFDNGAAIRLAFCFSIKTAFSGAFGSYQSGLDSGTVWQLKTTFRLFKNYFP